MDTRFSVKSNEDTENVFQELAEQVKEVMDLTQKTFERNEVIYKAMTTREFFQLNNKLSLTRKDVIDATLDIKNIASFNLLILQTVGRILSYIGFGLNEDELKTEQGKGFPDEQGLDNTRGLQKRIQEG